MSEKKQEEQGESGCFGGAILCLALMFLVSMCDLQPEEAQWLMQCNQPKTELTEWVVPERFADSVKIPEDYVYFQNWLTNDSVMRGGINIIFELELEDRVSYRFYRTDSIKESIDYTVFGEIFQTTRVWDFENGIETRVMRRLNDVHPFPERYVFPVNLR